MIFNTIGINIIHKKLGKKKKHVLHSATKVFQICVFLTNDFQIKIETNLYRYEIKCAIANKKPTNFFTYFIKNTLLKITLTKAKLLKLKDINRLGTCCFILKNNCQIWTWSAFTTNFFNKLHNLTLYFNVKCERMNSKRCSILYGRSEKESSTRQD